MYHTISNINKTINLQQYIDNKYGTKRIGLKSFTYTIGWYNLIDEYIQKETDRPIRLASGLYSFQQIADIFQSNNITLSANETNGKVLLTTPVDLKISKGLKEMLGLRNKRRLNANQTYEGGIPLNFAPYKQLYVHLEQINSANNFFDGAPWCCFC